MNTEQAAGIIAAFRGEQSADVREALRIAWVALRAQQEREHPKPLTLEQVFSVAQKTLNWVWIKILDPSKYINLKPSSAYYQIYSDYTEGEALCCGYPGLGWAFDFEDYGKTWLAYDHEPKEG